MRLDRYLTEKGIYKSRTRAANAIAENCVRVNGLPVTKNSYEVSENDVVDALPDPLGYVSRGALKLEFALTHYNIDVNGLTAVDIGASTGGFTEVLLCRGAKKVFSVDVGSGQLDPKIAGDPRVVSLEKTDVRSVDDGLNGTMDFACCDCSFISLKLVLPEALRLMKSGAKGIFLIKPQFEVGKIRGAIGKNGVVKDEKIRLAAVKDIVNFAESIGFHVTGTDEKIPESPIKGGDGNVEYLMCAIKK